MYRIALACAVGGCLLAGGVSAQQKYPGQTLPDITPPYASPPVAVPPPPTRVPAYRPPAFAPPPPSGAAERDPEAQAGAARLPLDPATANLQSRLPTDVPGTVRQLGLHVPNGSRVDMRGRRITTPEVIDALQH